MDLWGRARCAHTDEHTLIHRRQQHCTAQQPFLSQSPVSNKVSFTLSFIPHPNSSQDKTCRQNFKFSYCYPPLTAVDTKTCKHHETTTSAQHFTWYYSFPAERSFPASSQNFRVKALMATANKYSAALQWCDLRKNLGAKQPPGSNGYMMNNKPIQSTKHESTQMKSSSVPLLPPHPHQHFGCSLGNPSALWGCP